MQSVSSLWKEQKTASRGGSRWPKERRVSPEESRQMTRLPSIDRTVLDRQVGRSIRNEVNSIDSEFKW